MDILLSVTQMLLPHEQVKVFLALTDTEPFILDPEFIPYRKMFIIESVRTHKYHITEKLYMNDNNLRTHEFTLKLLSECVRCKNLTTISKLISDNVHYQGFVLFTSITYSQPEITNYIIKNFNPVIDDEIILHAISSLNLEIIQLCISYLNEINSEIFSAAVETEFISIIKLFSDRFKDRIKYYDFLNVKNFAVLNFLITLAVKYFGKDSKKINNAFKVLF